MKHVRPLLDGLDRRFGKRLHLHEPLSRNQRLDHGVASLAVTDVVRVVVGLLDQALFLQISDHPFAGLVSIQPGIGARLFGHAGVLADDFDNRQVVATTGFEIVRIVSGGNLHDSGSEFHVDETVGNDWDLPIHEGQNDRSADAGAGSARRPGGRPQRYHRASFPGESSRRRPDSELSLTG